MTRNDVLLIGSARLNRYRFLRVDLPFLPTSTDDVDLIFEFLDILRIHYIHGLEILVDTASQNFPITISLVVPSFVDVPRSIYVCTSGGPACVGVPRDTRCHQRMAGTSPRKMADCHRDFLFNQWEMMGFTPSDGFAQKDCATYLFVSPLQTETAR